MGANQIAWDSGIIRKTIMALTGLFLILFLLGHLAGNMQLFMSGEEGRLQFNAYAYFMTHNPAVKLLSYVTYLSILVHVVYSIVLTRKNRIARPVGYKGKGSASSTWNSRNMGILGTIILIFLVIHLKGFWYEMHWGDIGVDSSGKKDLHTVVVAAFSQLWYVILYVICMLFLAFHLSHGFASAFQSLGLGYSKYSGIIKKIGLGLAVIVPLLFAAMPVFIYFNQ